MSANDDLIVATAAQWRFIMQSKADIAGQKIENGLFNCAASVFSAFCEDYGIDMKTAMKLAGSFGGGCCVGEVCGAATGALLVVGLKHGQHEPGDMAAKDACYEKTTEFIEEFRKECGALTCRDILGADIRTEEGKVQKMERRHLCFAAVRTAAEILDKLGY